MDTGIAILIVGLASIAAVLFMFMYSKNLAKKQFRALQPGSQTKSPYRVERKYSSLSGDYYVIKKNDKTINRRFKYLSNATHCMNELERLDGYKETRYG